MLALFILLCTSAQAMVLAVARFDVASGEADFQPLGLGLAHMLVSDLSDVQGVRVVERERLDAVLREQSLVAEGLVDPTTAVRIGRLVGASDILTGAITSSGDRLRLDARLVNAEDGTVRLTVDVEGPRDGFFQLEAEMVRDLSRQLAKQPSAKALARQEARSRGSLAGAMAYGRALQQREAGDTEAALASARKAAEDNAGFTEAQQLVLELTQRDIFYIGWSVAAFPGPRVFPDQPPALALGANIEAGAFFGRVGVFGLLQPSTAGATKTLSDYGFGVTQFEERLQYGRGRVGAKIELARFHPLYINLVGGVEAVVGWHSQRQNDDLVRADPFLRLGPVGGIEGHFLTRNKMMGLRAAVTWSLHAPLDTAEGYIALNPPGNPSGPELSLGYTLFVGRRLFQSFRRGT